MARDEFSSISNLLRAKIFMRNKFCICKIVARKNQKCSALLWAKIACAIFDFIRAFLCLKEKRGKRSKKTCGFIALFVRAVAMVRSTPRIIFTSQKLFGTTCLASLSGTFAFCKGMRTDFEFYRTPRQNRGAILPFLQLFSKNKKKVAFTHLNSTNYVRILRYYKISKYL